MLMRALRYIWTGYAGVSLFLLVIILAAVILYVLGRAPMERVGSKALPWLPLDLRSIKAGESRKMAELFPADVKAVCAIRPHESSILDRMSRAQGNADLAAWARGDLDREQSQAVARFLKKYDIDGGGMYFLVIVMTGGQVYAFDRNSMNLPSTEDLPIASSPNCSTTKGNIVLEGSRASESFNIGFEAPRPATGPSQ